MQIKLDARGRQEGPAAEIPAREAAVLRVRVAGTTLEAAERLAREYAPGERLEEVLTAFVDDLATAADRPGSWEHGRVTAWLSSHPWPKREREEGR